MPFTIDRIRQALAEHRPRFLERDPSHAEAAVALVLAGAGSDLSLCAIRRAEHPLDPWSGHMALPGGRSDPDDPSPRAVAERETFEEVGIALGDEHRIGPLSDVLVPQGGGARRMILSSFVFYLGEELAPFTLSDEVAEAFWIPLSHLWDSENAGRTEWERNGARLLFPAITFQGHAIWGLTFRVLTLFSEVLDLPLPNPGRLSASGVHDPVP